MLIAFLIVQTHFSASDKQQADLINSFCAPLHARPAVCLDVARSYAYFDGIEVLVKMRLVFLASDKTSQAWKFVTFFGSSASRPPDKQYVSVAIFR